MKPNLGIMARYTRTVLGLTALSYASGSRRKLSLGHTLLVSVGAMKVAEGVTGWCPLQYLTDVLHGQSATNHSSTEGSALERVNTKTSESEENESALSQSKNDSGTSTHSNQNSDRQENSETEPHSPTH
jgi:Protein of unknown function (DUF2892)